MTSGFDSQNPCGMSIPPFGFSDPAGDCRPTYSDMDRQTHPLFIAEDSLAVNRHISRVHSAPVDTRETTPVLSRVQDQLTTSCTCRADGLALLCSSGCRCVCTGWHNNRVTSGILIMISRRSASRAPQHWNDKHKREDSRPGGPPRTDGQFEKKRARRLLQT